MNLFSVPFLRRLIFSLCVIGTNIAMAIVSNNNKGDCGITKKYVTKGKVTVAIILASETYPKLNRTIIKIPRAINAGIGINPKPTPSNVATPLPPLNPANIGNICPNTTAAAATICIYPGISISGKYPNITLDIKMANHPFKASMMKTGIPALYPKILMVFVVPAFPEPCSLTSTPKNNLPIHTELGIEPKT